MKTPLAAALFLAVVVQTASAQDCDLPANYTNRVTVMEGDMRVAYATDRSLYAPTEVVSFYLVVQNLGTTPFYVNWGIDPQDGHFILRPPFESLEECCTTNELLEQNALWYHPDFVYFYSQGTTLSPGQCRVWQRSIDLDWVTPVPETYTVLGGMFHSQLFYGDFVVPTGGARLHITIDNPIPTEDTTWGRVKALYR
jgi:hypothetical protein